MSERPWGTRPKWKLIGPPPKWFIDDAEVLAEMPMEALVEEIKRRGYGIIYRGKEDPDFDMEKGSQEAAR